MAESCRPRRRLRQKTSALSMGTAHGGQDAASGAVAEAVSGDWDDPVMTRTHAQVHEHPSHAHMRVLPQVA